MCGNVEPLGHPAPFLRNVYRGNILQVGVFAFNSECLAIVSSLILHALCVAAPNAFTFTFRLGDALLQPRATTLRQILLCKKLATASGSLFKFIILTAHWSLRIIPKYLIPFLKTSTSVRCTTAVASSSATTRKAASRAAVRLAVASTPTDGRAFVSIQMTSYKFPSTRPSP